MTDLIGSLSQDVDVASWYPEDESASIHPGENLQTVECAYRELRVAYVAWIKTVRKKRKRCLDPTLRG